MAAPFVFITTYAIKEGQLEAFRQFLQELFAVLEAKAPRLLAVNAYVNEDGSEAAIVQVHTDAASMKDYWRGLHQHSGRTLEQFVDATTSTQVYGDTGDLVLARTRHSAESGMSVSIKAEHLGGFTRPSAAVG